MRLVVTGAAGFIGSNVVAALNAHGHDRIVAVDDLTDGSKFVNLRDRTIEDYLDRDDFLARLESGRFAATVDAVLHQGACADTLEADGRRMLADNHRYTLALLDWCQAHAVPLVYASSAAVYGASATFAEEAANERPLNVYGWSKLLVDQAVRRRCRERLAAPVVGLRYFNVYGPGEAHKGRMASVAFHLFHALRRDGSAQLFEGSHGHAAGEQRRDFVWVGDAAAANLHFLGAPERSGIYNVGSGVARTFNDLALALLNGLRRHRGEGPLTLRDATGAGLLRYRPFPDDLRGRYQAYTCADIERLRAAGFDAPMTTLEAGIDRYLDHLLAEAA